MRNYDSKPEWRQWLKLCHAHTRTFDTDLLKSAGISTSMFNKIVMPGTQIGILRPELAEETGLAHIPIVAVAGHDTASVMLSGLANMASSGFIKHLNGSDFSAKETISE